MDFPNYDDVKINFKSPYNLLNVFAVKNELWARGIQADYPGHARSFDGSYESKVVINYDAFCIVCDMLCKTRQELAEERAKKRAKKRWPFRK